MSRDAVVKMSRRPHATIIVVPDGSLAVWCVTCAKFVSTSTWMDGDAAQDAVNAHNEKHIVLRKSKYNRRIKNEFQVH